MNETLTYADLQDAGNAQAQLILLAIARHANWDTGKCWPGQEILARMAKCSERTVRRYLEKMTADGLIRVEERRGEHGQRLADMITLVGYEEWITAIRAGGAVAKPKVVEGYAQPANLSGSQPDKIGGPTGQQVSGYNEPSKNSQDVLSARASEAQSLSDLESQLIEAAEPALDNPANCLGLLSLATPHMWLSQGCDLALDILPTLRAVAKMNAGKRVRSWDYFTRSVAQARANRLAGLPSVTADPKQSKNGRPSHAEVRAILERMSAGGTP